MSHHLFTYGTLRLASPHPMRLLLSRCADHAGTGRVAGRLVDLGRYPGLLEPDAPGQWVQGDLFRLHDPEPLLAQLDEYEGCAPQDGGTGIPPARAAYERLVRPVERNGGEPIEAWVYLYRLPTADRPILPHGDWVRWLGERGGG